MKLKHTLISSAVALGVIASATTVFAATKSSQPSTNTAGPKSQQTGQGWHHHGPRHPGQMVGAAKVLGISQATLKSDLQSGKSLVQIAKNKGMSETTLISKLESNFKTNLDQAVKSGKLTGSQETKILSNFNSHAKQFVERTGCAGLHGAPGLASKAKSAASA